MNYHEQCGLIADLYNLAAKAIRLSYQIADEYGVTRHSVLRDLANVFSEAIDKRNRTCDCESNRLRNLRGESEVIPVDYMIFRLIDKEKEKALLSLIDQKGLTKRDLILILQTLELNHNVPVNVLNKI